jgi:hypothetical protein
MPLRYFLLPIHVSLSFVHASTLGASVYLLLLRFLFRDHAAVQRLTGGVGTDAALTKDEEQIMEELGKVGWWW